MCSNVENMDTDVRGERVKLTKLHRTVRLSYVKPKLKFEKLK